MRIHLIMFAAWLVLLGISVLLCSAALVDKVVIPPHRYLDTAKYDVLWVVDSTDRSKTVYYITKPKRGR